MGQTIITEIKEIFYFAKRNYGEIVTVSFAVLFLILNEYHQVWNRWFSSLLFYAVLPIIIITVLLRRNPLDFGLRLGKPKLWVIHVILTCLISIPVLYFSSLNASLQNYYTIDNFNPFIYFLETSAYLFAWEFIFRGFLLFGLKDKFREVSILLQMVPFALLHVGKPEIETLSTIVTGIYLGYVVYRGNCYWPAFIIHLFINLTLVFLVNLL